MQKGHNCKRLRLEADSVQLLLEVKEKYGKRYSKYSNGAGMCFKEIHY